MITCKKPQIRSKIWKHSLKRQINKLVDTKNSWTRFFSEEAKSNFLLWRTHSDAEKTCAKILLKHLVLTFKHGGGSFIVCGVISAAGVVKLVFIEATIDSVRYVRIYPKILHDSVINVAHSVDFVFPTGQLTQTQIKIYENYFKRTIANC